MMDVIEKEKLSEKGQDFCNKALEHSRKGVFSQAVEIFVSAENIFVQLNDQKWLNFLRHEKAQAQRGLKKYEDALSTIESVISGYLDSDDLKGLALILTLKANIFLDQFRFQESLSCLYAAEFIAIDKKIDECLGYIYSNMVINYWELNDYVQALAYLDKALQYYTVENNPYECAFCYHYQGLCYQQVYSFAKAETHLEKSYQVYLRFNEINSALSVMEDLRKLYELKEDLEKSKKLNDMILRLGNYCTK